jgi:hypothetical protein
MSNIIPALLDSPYIANHRSNIQEARFVIMGLAIHLPPDLYEDITARFETAIISASNLGYVCGYSDGMGEI